MIVNGLWTYASLAAGRALVGEPTPLYVVPHGMLDPYFRRSAPLKYAVKRALWRLGEARLVNGARAVLFTTEEERRRARGFVRPYDPVERVVGYGAASPPEDAGAQRAAFLAAMPGLRDRRFLLYLGRLHPKKGVDLLLDAFAAAGDPGLDLAVVGPDGAGLLRPLQARARAAGIAGRVHWAGLTLGDAKWGLLRACEALVLPSHQENFGIVVAEALACGRPVLISDQVAIWREVEAAGAGLVAPDDAAGTRRLLDGFRALSPEARAAMGNAARLCFERHFDIRQAARRLVRMMAEDRDAGRTPRL